MFMGLIAVDSFPAEDLARQYHPYSADHEWVYSVSEEGDEFLQTVRAVYESEELDAEYRLEVMSKRRRARYEIHQDDSSVLLMSVSVKLPILPFWKTYRLAPPLPFLKFGDTPIQDWTWVAIEAYGPQKITRIDYSTRPLNQDARNWCEVDSLIVKSRIHDSEGNVMVVESVYGRYVGLLRVTSPAHTKTLIN